MPDRLYFTDSDEANALIASDPMALLIGFALDQQVPVQKAFVGPLVLRERLGSIDAATLAEADLEPVFRERPAIHRFPGSMARKVHALVAHVAERYDGDAGRIWRDAGSAQELDERLRALPGYGDMKVASLAAVLARRFGVAVAEPLIPSHPTLGDVDSPDAPRPTRPASARRRRPCAPPRLAERDGHLRGIERHSAGDAGRLRAGVLVGPRRVGDPRDGEVSGLALVRAGGALLGGLDRSADVRARHVGDRRQAGLEQQDGAVGVDQDVVARVYPHAARGGQDVDPVERVAQRAADGALVLDPPLVGLAVVERRVAVQP